MPFAIDARCAAIRHTRTPWALRRYRTLDDWQQRAIGIRRHILACSGLSPLPEKTPLKPRIFGRIERADHTVEKVFFESMPGFFVCGNLYRPLGNGPFPGIANPHGHWQRGRIENAELGSIPGRCINFARQGMVAFAYDMVGYNDSDQLSHRTFGGRREDLWGIGALSLQLWNSIRVVDFLESLPDVDAERIGCTGASGGGSQTFLLTAVDERIKASAVVNMVSAQMQGGCNCENQGHLRLGINNVEIASCMAPRPQLLVSCTGDWTVNTSEVEFPTVRDIYGLYGARKQVSQTQVDAEHNYNKPSREAVYAFFNRHFLGGKGKVAETPFTVEADADYLVFNSREKPAYALDSEGIVDALIERSEKRFASLLKKGVSWQFQEAMRPVLASLLGVEVAVDLAVESLGYRRDKIYVAEVLQLGRKGSGEKMRGTFFMPRGSIGEVPAVLVVADGARQKTSNGQSDKPIKLVRDLLSAGAAVLHIAPFLTDGATREGHDESQGHYHTYNQATLACRVQDILTGLAYLDQHLRVGKYHLVGQGQAGIWSIFARALAGDIERTAVDWARLDLSDDRTWSGELFTPGIRALGDVRTALALCAPGHLLAYGAGRRFPEQFVRKMYPAMDIRSNRASSTVLVEWIMADRPD